MVLLCHVIGIVAVLQLTSQVCISSKEKFMKPVEAYTKNRMTGREVYEDKLDAALQDIPDKFLASKKMSITKQDIRKITEQDMDVKDKVLAQTTSWPQGTYGFPQAIEGCPSGFSSGCRSHDSEDWYNANAFLNAGTSLQGHFAHDIQICYCSRTSSGSSSTSWPAGRYCINRVGGSCPSGFDSGFLYWDDETDINKNSKTGTLPDGEYGSNTKMYYCCRNDGSASTSITLPTSNSFVLYQYRERGCQSVSGMSSTEVIVHFDTEDYWNNDQCDTPVPYNPHCSGENHQIYMCHYRA